MNIKYEIDLKLEEQNIERQLRQAVHEEETLYHLKNIGKAVDIIVDLSKDLDE